MLLNYVGASTTNFKLNKPDVSYKNLFLEDSELLEKAFLQQQYLNGFPGGLIDRID